MLYMKILFAELFQVYTYCDWICNILNTTFRNIYKCTFE